MNKINQISLSINNLICNINNEKLNKLHDLIFNEDFIYFTGIGKNGHIAAIAASTFNSISKKSIFINPIDCLHGDMGLISNNSLIIAISKSGNTPELISFLTQIKNKKTQRIVLIHSNENNDCLKLCSDDLFIPLDKELDHLNIVPTTSLILYLTVLYAIAAELAQGKNLTMEQFVFNHPGGSIGQIKC